MRRHHYHHAAFTLVELLVVLGVISMLTALVLPVVGKVRRQGSMTKEIAAGRQLMTAYAQYAAENDGELLPGYGDFPATDERGDAIHNPVNCRYPWRLAPYVQYEMRLFWGNDSDDRIRALANGPRAAYHYAVSVQPAFGINAAFVGGDYQVIPPTNEKALSRYGRFCVTRLTHAVKPSQLIVLASAAGEYQGEKLTGYFKVEAPNFLARNWADSASAGSLPEETGHVDFRWEGKTVVMLLDGHSELLTFDQMNDMRRWSNQASTADEKNWKLGMSDEPAPSSSQTSTGGHINGRPTNTLP